MKLIESLLLSFTLLMFSHVCLAEAPLGRLFSTPAQRSNLEQLRQVKKIMPTGAETSVQEVIVVAPPKPLPAAINLQGYVKRSDGQQGTIWINGQALQENSGNKEVTVGALPADGNRVPIKLPANGKQFTLKAGQVYDPENNRVREARSHGVSGSINGNTDAIDLYLPQLGNISRAIP